jgi:hypothetical protein
MWWASLSLWIVAGMVQDSRADGEALGPYCNCGDAEEGNTGLPTAIS